MLFACLFKLQELWLATPDSLWCLRLSGYFWTLQVHIFISTAHLEHQLLFCWFTALAFVFELIRGKMRYCFVSFLTTRRDSNLTDKTQLPVWCLQVWYQCVSDRYPWKHLNTIPSGVAMTGDDIFTVACPAVHWWWPCCDVWAYIAGIQPTDDHLSPIPCSGGESA